MNNFTLSMIAIAVLLAVLVLAKIEQQMEIENDLHRESIDMRKHQFRKSNQ